MQELTPSELLSPEEDAKMTKQILAYLKQSKQEDLQDDPEAMAQIKKQFLEEQQQVKISKMHQ